MNDAKNVRAQGFRQFAIGMVAYTVIVIATGFLVDPENISTLLGVALVLPPVAAVIWAMAGWLKAIRTFDELQQKVFAEAGLISLGLTAAATVTYGFLEVLVSAPQISMFVVFPFVAATFGIAFPLTKRRYS